MRVLHVVRQFHPCVGGLERFTLDLGRQLVARGYEVGVATLDRPFGKRERLPARERVEGITVRRLPCWGWRGYPLAPGVLPVARGYDVVHVHALDFFADYLALTRRLHRRPLVLSTHGGFFHTSALLPLKRLFFATVTRRTLRAYAAVACSGREDWRRFGPRAPGRACLIENAVDPARFGPVERRPEPGRLLTVGRISANKGLDRLIAAVAVAARMVPEMRLDVVGEDWGGLRPELERQAQGLGVADRVRFHGLLPDEGVGDLMGRAQWFVSASAYEGFGLAVVEGMAVGLPPLLNDIPAFRHLIRHGEQGFLLDFADPMAAGTELARLVRVAPERLETLGEAARVSAGRFTWPAVAERFDAIYRRVAAQ